MLKYNVKSQFSDFSLDINFQLPKGIHCLFGASGAGKSLSLKILAGLIKADQEEIILNGKVLSSNSDRISLSPQQREIGFVFQRPTVFPHMTVIENILYGLRDGDINEIANVMALLGIQDLKNKHHSQLSGGQAQRVSIARTLVNSPQLLILDEPFTALDTPLRVSLRKDLSKVINEMNISALIVTHDLIEAMDMCEHMILIDKGRILQQGLIKEIIAAPASETAAKYLDLKNYGH